MKDRYIHRREKEDNFFARLQKETLEELQSLSGNIWSDYNLHDPGVTIAEVLHYALYELQYQLQFPFATYLCVEGKPDFEKFGLLPAKTITADSIVTPKDYEALVLKRVKGVVNCKFRLNKKHKYKIIVELAGGVKVEAAKHKIEKLYHSKRNLCETLGEIVVTRIGNPQQTLNASGYAPAFFLHDNDFVIQHRFPPVYHSIQRDFPDTYGVNEKGMPMGITNEHKAKIMQLKAYLLIYDHLLANTLHQSAGVHKLLELSEDTIPPYRPHFSIDKMEELTDSARFGESKLQDKDFTDMQKSHFLDFLDVIYGEDTKAFYAHEKHMTVQNSKRMELIKKLPLWNADRMRSFDVFAPKISADIPLLQIIKAVLGFDLQEESSILQLLAKYNLRLVNDEELYKNYQNLDIRHYIVEYLRHQNVEYQTERIPEEHLLFEDSMFAELEKNLTFFFHNILFDTLLQYGDSLDNYMIINNPESGTSLLIFLPHGSEKLIYLGFSADKQFLAHLANELQSFLKMIKNHSKPVLLVEHILLDVNEEDYDKLSIIIPDFVHKATAKAHYETLIKERLPVHLDARIIWFPLDRFHHIEQDYYFWRRAILHKNDKERKVYAVKLSRAIYKHKEPGTGH